jgi:transposase-like protein
MDERLRFLARVLDGEPMTEVCRDFGISRKTGYRIFDRYKEHGLEALSDRSRRPVRLANQLPAQLEGRVVASPNALFNLSKLAVWWLRLGIDIERIKPGRTQQNGRHERMHLTLKIETVRPPGANSLRQQARFDEFVREFYTERPHEALEMKCPANVYTPARKTYSGLPDLSYPFHDRDVLVTACGRIGIYRKKINLSIVLAGQRVGIKMRYDLGYIDLEARTLQPLDNPFGPRLSPLS